MDEMPSRYQNSDLYKKALSNLLKRKEYHIASPTKKRKMLMEEYSRILKKKNNC